MTRNEIIDAIKSAVLQDRTKEHGPPEKTFDLIARYWTVYIEHRKNRELTPEDVCAMMILFKVARTQMNSKNADSWTDAGGYAVCGGELATEKNKK